MKPLTKKEHAMLEETLALIDGLERQYEHLVHNKNPFPDARFWTGYVSACHHIRTRLLEKYNAVVSVE